MILKDTKQNINQRNTVESFYMSHKDGVYSFLLNILNYNKDDASQILSDSFVKLWEYLENNHVENMKTFIYTTAHNLAVNHIKKNQKNTVLADDSLHYNTLLEEANFNFEQQQIQNIIKTMDVMTRKVLHLLLYEEKSYQEISDILKIPKNTVWTIYFQAKAKLKKTHLHHLP